MTKKIILVLILCFFIISFAMHLSEYSMTPDTLFQNAQEVYLSGSDFDSHPRRKEDIGILLTANEREKIQFCMHFEKMTWSEQNECVGVYGTPGLEISIINSTLPGKEIIITDELACGTTPKGRFIYPFRWKWNWLDRIFMECATCGQEGIHHKVFFEKNCFNEFLSLISLP